RLEARLAQLETEQAHWASRGVHLREEAERWADLQEHAGIRLAQAEARHEEAAGRLPELEEALRSAESNTASARRELAQTEQQQRVEETRCSSARRSLEAFSARRARLEQEAVSIDGPDPAQLAEREARLAGVEELVETLASRQLDLQSAFPLAQQTLKQAVDEERGLQREATE
ncbi:MAG: chromosome segregation protein SMC, partial [Rhodocyclaceae bacterium]|nr:chromosome segregation protein SMC [Rhodocyclaceae bacterium]